MDLPRRKEFPEKGVIVIIPESAPTVEVNLLEPPAFEEMPVDPIGFHPFRLITNIKMVDTTQPNKKVVAFDKPVVVHVHYTKADYDLTEAVRRPLCLGFWDGTQWIPYTSSKHHFQLVSEASPEDGGWGIFEVLAWGDPPHAWGT